MEKHCVKEGEWKRINKAIENFENRITAAEVTSGRLLEKMDMLIQRMESIISIGKAITMGTIATLLSFFIWYVQSL